MAASPVQPPELHIADLRELRARELAPLLAEQTVYWKERLRWDFRASQETIQRFLEMRSLYGYALLSEDRPVGYSYFVQEDHKALVGDLFVSAPYRGESAERLLLQQTLKAAVLMPGVRRIEGQLLGLSFRPSNELIYGRSLNVYDRDFMLAAIGALPPPAGTLTAAVRFEHWRDYFLDAAAELIAACYRGHVDSQINDQYQSRDGARRFVANTTQHPGCGVFFRRAATAAFDRASGYLCGLCLGSLVESRTGHITQLCVSPHVQRAGLGRELLRRSMQAFRDHGADAASLTVTSSNRGAIRLYEAMGFRTIRKFCAFVWQSY